MIVCSSQKQCRVTGPRGGQRHEATSYEASSTDSTGPRRAERRLTRKVAQYPIHYYRPCTVQTSCGRSRCRYVIRYQSHRDHCSDFHLGMLLILEEDISGIARDRIPRPLNNNGLTPYCALWPIIGSAEALTINIRPSRLQCRLGASTLTASGPCTPARLFGASQTAAETAAPIIATCVWGDISSSSCITNGPGTFSCR